MDDVAELIVNLKAEGLNVRMNAVKALMVIGSPSVPLLMDALKAPDAKVRPSAAYILGEIKDPQAVPALIMALKDTDAHVRREATKALNKIASSDPTPALRNALPTLRRLRKNSPVFQEALDKIMAATAGMKDLPLPSASPMPDANSLPLPSNASTTSPDGLPVPSVLTADNTSDCLSQDAKTRSHCWMRQEKRR